MCIFLKEDIVSYSWSKGETLQSSKNFPSGVSSSGAILRIRNFQESQFGIYTCLAVDLNGNEKTLIVRLKAFSTENESNIYRNELPVEELPAEDEQEISENPSPAVQKGVVFIPSKAEFEVRIEPSKLSVEVNDLAEFKCVVYTSQGDLKKKDLLDFTFTWSREKPSTLPINRVNHGHQLRMHFIKESDSGEYQCSVKNIDGYEKTAIAKLRVNSREVAEEKPVTPAVTVSTDISTESAEGQNSDKRGNEPIVVSLQAGESYEFTCRSGLEVVFMRYDEDKGNWIEVDGMKREGNEYRIKLDHLSAQNSRYYVFKLKSEPIAVKSFSLEIQGENRSDKSLRAKTITTQKPNEEMNEALVETDNNSKVDESPKEEEVLDLVFSLKLLI